MNQLDAYEGGYFQLIKLSQYPSIKLWISRRPLFALGQAFGREPKATRFGTRRHQPLYQGPDASPHSYGLDLKAVYLRIIKSV
jgi:hypothetical protein